MKLVTRKLTKFQPKLKSSFRLGFEFGFKPRISFKPFQSKLHFRYLASQTLHGGVLLVALVLVTFLSPILKKSYEPQIANAAPPAITRLSQTIGQPDGGDKIIIQGSNFNQDIVFSQVSAGNRHTCAIGTNGEAYCWGSNNSCQLGDNDERCVDRTTPVAVFRGAIPTGVSVQQILAGGSHTCAFGSNNKVYCWGSNGNGALGNGTTINLSRTPVAVAQGHIPDDVTIQQISTNYSHTCTLGSNNEAYCWGWNYYGQLGDSTSGSVNNKNTPVAVAQGHIPDDVTIQRISAGNSHTCALDSDDKAYCWGYNYYGQLGDETSGGDASKITPIAVSQGNLPDNAVIQQIVVGTYHTCALDLTGQAYCWGYNYHGQLGDETTIDRVAPVAVAQGHIPDNVTIKQLSTVGHFVCALGSDNKVYCWGDNSHGQLGDGTSGSDANKAAPVAVSQGAIPTNVIVQQISTGFSHACAIGSNNQVYCWGYNYYGQLGSGNKVDSSTPIAVDISILPKTQVLFGTIPATSVRYISPHALEVTVPAHEEGSVDITVTNPDGTTFTKTNAYTYENPSTPEITSISPNEGLIYGGEEITFTGTNLHNMTWKKMATGNANHNCAINLDDKVYCWGENKSGQIGNGTTSDQLTPVIIAQGDIPSDAHVVSIAVGGRQTCAIASNNKAYCWGENHDGQLGNGLSGGSADSFDSGIDRNVPTEVQLGQIPIDAVLESIVTGGISFTGTVSFHTCAIADGKAYCWGSNGSGQLGVSGNADRTSPVAVKADNPTDVLYDKIITQITVGNIHTCAVDSNGKSYCWGNNYFGQLGNGDNTSEPVLPVAVDTSDALAGKSIIQIVAGKRHTCAIGSDNRAYCWGENNTGQLGDSTNIARNSPTAVSIDGVLAGKTIIQLSAGGEHSCAFDSNNQVYCWGYNYYGQLGNGNTTNSYIPVGIDASGALAGKVVAQIYSGYEHSCALDSNSQAYCWGSGLSGQLGEGVPFLRVSSPAVVRPGYLVYFGDIPTNLGLYQGERSEYGPKITNTELKIATPAVSQSTVVNVTVELLASNTIIGSQIYTFTDPPVPTVSSVTPKTGSPDGDTNLVIYGDNLSNIKVGDGWSQISSGYAHSCALDSNNQAYCWGLNYRGQLGNNDTVNSPIPVTADITNVLANKTILQIEAGGLHSCALDSDGEAYCWGDNSHGQLGDGTTDNSSIPVAVNTDDALAGKTISRIAVGVFHTCAIASDGQVYCWGLNNYGQLGNGITDSSSIPVAVNTDDALAGKTIL